MPTTALFDIPARHVRVGDKLTDLARDEVTAVDPKQKYTTVTAGGRTLKLHLDDQVTVARHADTLADQLDMQNRGVLAQANSAVEAGRVALAAVTAADRAPTLDEALDILSWRVDAAVETLAVAAEWEDLLGLVDSGTPVHEAVKATAYKLGRDLERRHLPASTNQTSNLVANATTVAMIQVRRWLVAHVKENAALAARIEAEGADAPAYGRKDTP